jgi:ammonia channel protein AmtB
MGGLVWVVIGYIEEKKFKITYLMSGVFCGLAGITPGSGIFCII